MKTAAQRIGDLCVIGVHPFWIGALLFLASPSLAPGKQFGLFTYDEYGLNDESIIITDYPRSALGHVDVPAEIEGKPVTFLGNDAFSGCVAITGISMPPSVTTIGSHCFNNCHSLTDIALSPSLLLIAFYAFQNCTALTSLTIPSTVTNLTDSLFPGCRELTSISVLPGGPAYTSVDGVVFNSAMSELVFYPPGRSAPYTIPDGVSSIKVGAFWTASISEITLPDGLLTVGRQAFQDCGNLNSITFPSSVTTFQPNTFFGCHQLTSIEVAAGNAHYSSVEGVVFDAAGTELVRYPTGRQGPYSMAEGIVNIHNSAFQDCRNLTGISFPSTLREIGSFAFARCYGLTAITVPEGVTTLGEGAFSSCQGLQSATLETPLTTIEDGLFHSCHALREITLPPTVTSIGRIAFSECLSLAKFDFPVSVTEIGLGAFWSCPSLASLILPPGLTTIGEGAFRGCHSLTTVSIPATVIVIERSSFTDCREMKTMVFLGNAPAVESMGNLHPDFTIYHLSDKTGFPTDHFLGSPIVSIDPAADPAGFWLASNGYRHDSDLESDANGDGIVLLMAYALSLDPRQDLNDKLPSSVLGPDLLSLTYYGANPDIDYLVETSSDLAVWDRESVSVSGPDHNGHYTATVDSGSPQRFLRLVVARD